MTNRLAVIIHDELSKRPLSTHICDTRSEAVSVVKRELSRFFPDGGFFLWLRSPDDDWQEQPVMCRIIHTDGRPVGVDATIEEITISKGG